MRRQNHLFDQVVSFKNLHQAALQAVRGKKNKPKVACFVFHLDANFH